ncbi:hypothetical protein AB8O53_25750 [Streptomyces pilosus]
MRRGVRARAGAIASVLAAAWAVAGCGAADSGHPRTADPPAGRSASPSPRVTSDEDLCTRIVGHWSRELLDGRGYGDYQSMGLSGGQYDILREVVDSARAARRQGTADVGKLIDREARAGCAAWYRSGGPGTGPWR